MSTIITKNSATSGSTPPSLIQGELAINVTDGRLFYGSGSGNVVKEFTGSASGGTTIDTGSFVTTSSFNAYTGSNTSQFAGTASYATNALTASYAEYAVSASYEINYETSSSYADFAVSASHALNADNAISASHALNSISSSYSLTSTSASHAISADNAITASYIQTAQTASYVLQAVSASYALTASYSNTSTSASHAVNADDAISSSYALSASYATTSSYAIYAETASYAVQALSSSHALTASYVNPLYQTVQITGSLTTTGSNIFIGNQTVTGSLFTTGSNTLVGNTVLSGTLQIQGQYPPSAGSESVSIVGNVDLNGYLRFDPVTSNINNSISASYIYVSGSTNDLYFSQNGDGYSNTTRLRWLEGNIYTGILTGGVVSGSIGGTTFNVSSGSGIIVTLNATTASIEPYPTIEYVQWPSFTNITPTFLNIQDTTWLGIDSNGNLIQQANSFYNGQFDDSLQIGSVIHPNLSTISLFKTFTVTSYGIAQQTYEFIRSFGAIKVSGHTISPSGSSLSVNRDSGVAFALGRNYINDANKPSLVNDASYNAPNIFRYYKSGSVFVTSTGTATVDPAQYNTPTSPTGLSPTPGGQYTIQRIFYFPNQTNTLGVYYGRQTYNSISTALANLPYETFEENNNTLTQAIFVAYLIVKGGTTNLSNTSDAQFIQAGTFRNTTSGGGGASTISLDDLSDVVISNVQHGDLLTYDGAEWVNLKQLTGSYGLTGSLTATSFTGSLQGTATTASYVLQAVSASFASTASYVNQLNQIVRVGNDIELDNQIGAVVANSFDAGLGNVFIDGLTGEVTATTFIGDLTGTASYATQALSASWAPGGNPFPFTGSAGITGSLTVVGKTQSTQIGAGAAPSGSVPLDVRAQGALSTDIAFRVRNSANTVNLFAVNGNSSWISRNNSNSNQYIYWNGTNRLELKNDASGEAFISNNHNGLGLSGATGLRLSAGNKGIYIYNSGNFYVGNASGIQAGSGQGNILFANNTAPSTNVVNHHYYYSADIVAGNAAPHFRTEAGNIVKLYTQAAVTSSQGIADVLTNLGFLTGISTIASTNPFPYTGSAEITGSLGVTGSFSLQTFNGLTDVTALDFSGVTRVINDVMGTSSINADERDLYDSSAINSVNWEIRRLISTNTAPSIDWENRFLQDPAGTVTVDWASPTLYDNNATYALNWNDRDLYDSSAINSVNWEARRLIDSSGVIVMRWDQRLTYDTVNSQSIDWNIRQLKFDNDASDYTVDWNEGILQDTAAKFSVDWQNRQLKNSSGNEVLNWSSGVAITGSLTVSGSSTFTNIGPAQFSGSFGIQGAGDGYAGPFTAITIDDANYTRTLHDFLTGASSLDFGNRALVDGNGKFVLSWDGTAGYINSGLYYNATVGDTTRNTLLTFQAHAGQTLDEVTFDSTVADFDLVYLSTGSTWFPVDQATDSSTKLLGICLGYDPESGLGTVILEGDVSVSTSAGSAPVVDNANYGLPVYIAEGAGNTMDTTIPIDGYVRVLGHCYHTDGDDNWIMKFRPSNDWIEV